jgi:Tfp pilus assembly protein PilN
MGPGMIGMVIGVGVLAGILAIAYRYRNYRSENAQDQTKELLAPLLAKISAAKNEIKELANHPNDATKTNQLTL